MTPYPALHVSELIRKLLGKVLAKLGFTRVEHAHNGGHGLETLVTNAPYSGGYFSTRPPSPVPGWQHLIPVFLALLAVAFMDMLMPIMTGIDCVSKFRAWEATQAGRPHQVDTFVMLARVSIVRDIEPGMECVATNPPNLLALNMDGA